MKPNLLIRSLTEPEIETARDFAPPEWNFDLAAFFRLHFNKPYFCPLAGILWGDLIGLGNGIINNKVGWLGNIIVLPDYRRQGIGYRLTEKLMRILSDRGCTTQLLIATEMGEPVYKKLGFVTCSTYEFYKRQKNFACDTSSRIRKIQLVEFSGILKMDRNISGENRQSLLEQFIPSGWLCSNEAGTGIDGFYLPAFGNGLILAQNADSGIELLKFRLTRDRMTSVVIPAQNQAARDFLRENGFIKYLEAPRMALGPEPAWKPENVFNRGAGYCG